MVVPPHGFLRAVPVSEQAAIEKAGGRVATPLDLGVGGAR